MYNFLAFHLQVNPLVLTKCEACPAFETRKRYGAGRTAPLEMDSVP